jgi:sulfatase modifying factor 1
MKNLNETKQVLRELLIKSIPELISSLKAILPQNSARYQDLILIEGRFRDINLSVLRGVISNEDMQLAYNQLRMDLLELINGLKERDLESVQDELSGSATKSRTGSILYRIPDAMQLEHEHKCVVRIAYQESMLAEDIELDDEVQIQQIRISDVMMVQLLEPTQDSHFHIRVVNSAEQFLDEDTFTEWLFYVRPKVAGSFALLLKVSVVEQVNGKERCREIVLEERVEVVAKTIESIPEADLKKAPFNLALAGGFTDDTQIYAKVEPSEKNYKVSRKNPFSIGVRTLALIGVIVVAGFFVFRTVFTLQRSDENYFSIDDPNEKRLPEQAANEIGQPADSSLEAPPPLEEKKPAITKDNKRISADNYFDGELVLVRGGTFTMGCDGGKEGTCPPNTTPKRKIKIENFYIGVTEVTTTQYAAFLNEYLSETVKEGRDKGKAFLQDTPWLFKDTAGKWVVLQGMENLPAFFVTWYGAMEYAKHYGMRLPSEAEWEYAARGGRTQSGYKYSGSDNPEEVAWFRGNADNRVHAVRMKAANALGLFDMSGNVWEWTADCGHPDYRGAPQNGQAWIQGGDCGIRMLRGGSFTFGPESALNYSRQAGKAIDGQHHVGFRVARDQ